MTCCGAQPVLLELTCGGSDQPARTRTKLVLARTDLRQVALPEPTSARCCWASWTPTPGWPATGRASSSSATRTTSAATSWQPSPGVGLKLLRPVPKGEAERAGSHFFKPLRQAAESIFDSYKGQLDLKRHGGKTSA